MTDTPGSTPPFPGFPGFPPAEMLDRMWDMMRFTPFGTAFPGAQPGAAQGMGPSFSMMSDMMAPLTNVEELDKRITDMRAVEQWLKLNLNMLQSAIQALEVQRATLATLRAFGAFAQSQMTQPTASAEPTAFTSGSFFKPRAQTPPEPPPREAEPEPEPEAPESAAAGSDADEDVAPGTPPFDASMWWNMLQSQFNQLAQVAMTESGAAAGATPRDDEAAKSAATKPRAKGPVKASAKTPVKESAKRPATKRAVSPKGAGGVSGHTAGDAPTGKKSP